MENFLERKALKVSQKRTERKSIIEVNFSRVYNPYERS